MKCPNCGKDVEEGNFCSACGQRLDGDNTQNPTTIKDADIIKGFLKTIDVKKALSLGFAVVLLATATVFGMVQHKQYQEDIAPLELNGGYGGIGDALTDVKYDSNNKRALFNITCKEVLGKDWLKLYIEEFQKNNPNVAIAELSIPENDYTKGLKIEFIRIDLQPEKPIILKFKIDNMDSKEFVNLKDNLLLAQKSRQIFIKKLKVIDKNPKVQNEEKTRWQKQKEEEERIARAIEAEKNRCEYRTSNGVCFKTKKFIPKPLNYYNCSGGLTTYGETVNSISEYSSIGIKQCEEHLDDWAGAMKQCSDWGYKLPNTHELASLAVDIYGVTISNQIGVDSYLPDGHKVNNEPIEALNLSTGGMYSSYWEDKNENELSAFARYLGYNYTHRGSTIRGNWFFQGTTNALCVTNPSGIAKSSYSEYVREKERQAELKKQEEIQRQIEHKKEMKSSSEDFLF